MPQGKAYILTSGHGTTNSYAYSARYGALGYAKITLGVENVGNGSGGGG